jgi:RHS repeat-associated protein
VEYVQFGEVFLEEKNAVWNTPYLFNGKELDKETGLSYYGARYYDSKISVWLSVDPLAEKYPSFSPYCFVGNNPIKNIEVDGRYWVGTDGKAVAVHKNKDGSLGIGKNASADLKRYVALINASGSTSAVAGFMNIASNKTKVNFKIETKKIANDRLGLHQPHDKDGPIKWKAGTGGTGVFERKPDYIDDGNGNKVYREATITLYEANFTDSQLEIQQYISNDSNLTKNEMMVATGTHEIYHDIDPNTLDAIRTRANGGTDNYDVEAAAENNAENKVYQEIKTKRNEKKK